MVVCSPALPAEAAAEVVLSRRLTEEAGGYPAAGGAHAFQLSSSTLLSLPTMAFCFSSQSLFPPALETLHQPATYHHLHTVVDSTMLLTPPRIAGTIPRICVYEVVFSGCRVCEINQKKPRFIT